MRTRRCATRLVLGGEQQRQREGARHTTTGTLAPAQLTSLLGVFEHLHTVPHELLAVKHSGSAPNLPPFRCSVWPRLLCSPCSNTQGSNNCEDLLTVTKRQFDHFTKRSIRRGGEPGVRAEDSGSLLIDYAAEHLHTLPAFAILVSKFISVACSHKKGSCITHTSTHTHSGT